MPTFDFVVVGCGGGPDEHNLSSYLFKPSRLPWSAGAVALEAGSGLGALTRILGSNPTIFGTRPEEDGQERTYSAAEVLAWIRCYLITHAHMDHTSGLVMCAGSIPGGPRKIHAVHQTLEDMQSVFSNRLWPRLASWDSTEKDMSYTYSDLHVDGEYQLIDSDASILVRTMLVSHGSEGTSDKVYDSSAFFVRDNTSSQEFLFFGDVEPDAVSAHPRLCDVWAAAAPMIPERLSTIFIECSFPIGRQDHLLYGHMNPEHLTAELAALAEEVVRARGVPTDGDGRRASVEGEAGHNSSTAQRSRKKPRRNPLSDDELRDALRGVRIYIIHCKSDLEHRYDRPIHMVIAEQVRSLVEKRGLGAEIIAAAQGMQISI